MNQTDLTPVAVITMLASLIFSASVASVVGPYVVIGIGAMGGAAVALMQAEARGRFKAFLFFFVYTSLAVLLTVPVSMLVTTYFTSVQQHWLFAPMSFGLGFVADKWPAVLSAIGRKIGTFIDLLIQLRGPKA
jgi:hypothetical protein